MFFQKLCFSSNLVSLCQFRLIHSIFRSIEIFLKCFNEPLSVSIDRNYFSINRNSWIGFFLKLRFDLFKSLFQNFFKLFSLSPTWQGSTEIFCRFPSFFLQGISLPTPVCTYYPFFFIHFLFYMHFSCIEGLFSDLAFFWGFWWFKPYFLKLIIGFLF